MAQDRNGERGGEGRGASPVSDKFHKDPRGGPGVAMKPGDAAEKGRGAGAERAREARPESMPPGKRTQSK